MKRDLQAYASVVARRRAVAAATGAFGIDRRARARFFRRIALASGGFVAFSMLAMFGVRHGCLRAASALWAGRRASPLVLALLAVGSVLTAS